MKKVLIGLVALALSGCSMASLQNFNRNLAAADCASPAAMQSFVANLPPNPFVNGAQQMAIMQQACVGLFGTVAAPATAMGNVSALPAITVTAAPSVTTTVPAAPAAK